MTVLEVIQRSTEFLGRKRVESPRLQVELLLAHVLQVPRLRLYLDFERKLTEPELERVRQLVKQRGHRQPLQHLVGSTSFCGLEIKVSPDVLIPRPETELLAERGWQFLNALNAGSEAGSAPALALDLGTGSGCIAVAVAHHAPQANLLAVDISSAALDVARENVARHQLASRVQLLAGDGFDALPAGARFDLILSNPPYIPSAEIAHLAPEVRDHDPWLALDGGPDGLAVLRALAARGAEFLKPGGQVMCEFGDGQADAVRRVFEQCRWRMAAVVPDLSGRARILVASMGGS